MKKYIFFITIINIIARPLSSELQVALIDTTYRTSYSYNNLTTLAQEAGVILTHMHPSTDLTQKLCGYDGIFLALDNQFLSHQQSEYAQLIIEPLKTFLKQSQRLFFILLPSQITTQKQTHNLENLLAHLGITIPSQTLTNFINYKAAFKPDYLTIHPSGKRLGAFSDHIITLPHIKPPDYLINNMPLAIVLEDPNHTVCIGTHSDFTFAELEEDEFKNPIDPYKRKELLRACLHAISDMQHTVAEKRNLKPLKVKYPILNQLINAKRQRLNCKMYRAQRGLYRWASNGIACAWMSIDYDHKFMQENLAYIAQADFDMLWLELPITLYKKKEFDDNVRYFTQLLRQAYETVEKPMPKIFLDFDFGATLKWCTDTSAPIDIYGISYKKIPAPLDYASFWRPCILDTLKTVCTLWKKDIGNELPINGILFNFYFWNERTMPFYTNLIDVSDSAWSPYARGFAPKHQGISIQKRITYLLEKNKLPEYLDFLEQSIFQLTEKIKNDIRSILPCTMIAAYTVTPLDTWFYKGMMRGLSSKQNPLLWFTNNINFYGHHYWLEDNNIDALHSTNMLLANFNDKKNIRTLNKMARTHDGLWYSRASRMGQPYKPNQWWSAEATTMDAQELIKIIDKQTKK